MDAANLTTETAGEFTGTIIDVYASSSNQSIL